MTTTTGGLDKPTPETVDELLAMLDAETDPADDDAVLDVHDAEDKLAEALDRRAPAGEKIRFADALAIARRAPRATLNAIAALEILHRVRAVRRERARAAEEEAERAARRAAQEAREAERSVAGLSREEAAAKRERLRKEDFWAKIKHGSMNKYNGGAYHGCGCDRCVEVAGIEARANDRLLEAVVRITTDHTEALKISWTKELLETAFALPDGSIVLWGAATVEQHTERRDMLVKNAAGNVRAAARHEAAIADLTAAQVETLFDLNQESAA